MGSEKRRILSHYLHWRNVPRALFLAVRQHLLYMWEVTEAYDEIEQNVMSHLPPVLKKELCYHIYGQYLRTAPFLAWMHGYDICMKELARLVELRLLYSGDHLFRVGEPNDQIFVVI